MRKDLYQDLYELEEKHWWHIAKRENAAAGEKVSGSTMSRKRSASAASGNLKTSSLLRGGQHRLAGKQFRPDNPDGGGKNIN